MVLMEGLEKLFQNCPSLHKHVTHKPPSCHWKASFSWNPHELPLDPPTSITPAVFQEIKNLPRLEKMFKMQGSNILILQPAALQANHYNHGTSTTHHEETSTSPCKQSEECGRNLEKMESWAVEGHWHGWDNFTQRSVQPSLKKCLR